LRSDDPSDYVRNNAREDSSGKGDEEPEDSHERDVLIEILSQTGTNSCDLSVTYAQQFLRSRQKTYQFATVRTEPAILSNGFAASVAVHGSASLHFDTMVAEKRFRDVLPLGQVPTHHDR
jgi:hypothetical protein